VVINTHTWTVDHEATARCRSLDTSNGEGQR
jgi:hypothetical protein